MERMWFCFTGKFHYSTHSWPNEICCWFLSSLENPMKNCSQNSRRHSDTTNRSQHWMNRNGTGSQSLFSHWWQQIDVRTTFMATQVRETKWQTNWTSSHNRVTLLGAIYIYNKKKLTRLVWLEIGFRCSILRFFYLIVQFLFGLRWNARGCSKFFATVSNMSLVRRKFKRRI